MAGGADDLALAHDHLAAHHGHDRPALEAPAVIEAVIGIGAELGRAHHALLGEVDQGEIGVGPYEEAALALVEAEEACWVGGEELGDARKGEAALV